MDRVHFLGFFQDLTAHVVNVVLRDGIRTRIIPNILDTGLEEDLFGERESGKEVILSWIGLDLG